MEIIKNNFDLTENELETCNFKKSKSEKILVNKNEISICESLLQKMNINSETEDKFNNEVCGS